MDMVKTMMTADVQLKKLVYLYLINYAKSNPELARAPLPARPRRPAAEPVASIAHAAARPSRLAVDLSHPRLGLQRVLS